MCCFNVLLKHLICINVGMHLSTSFLCTARTNVNFPLKKHNTHVLSVLIGSL